MKEKENGGEQNLKYQRVTFIKNKNKYKKYNFV